MNSEQGSWEPPKAPPASSNAGWDAPQAPPEAWPAPAQPAGQQQVPQAQVGQPQAQPQVAQPAGAQAQTAPQPDPAWADAPEYFGAAPERKAGWQGPLRIIGLIVGLLAFGGLGFAAAQGIFGDNTGADSANEAVDELMQAMSDEDVIAMIEVMSPSEIGRLGEFYPRLIKLAQDDGELVGDDPLAGIDISVEGLVTETVELHPDVNKVYMREGVIKVVIDPEAMDPALRRDYENSGETQTEWEYDLANLESDVDTALDEGRNVVEELNYQLGLDINMTSPSGAFMMTVKQNGRWYISPFYTAAEYGREVLDLPPADFTASRENRMEGATSAEGVLTGLEEMVNGRTLEGHLDAALSMDADAFSQLAVFMPPNELGVFMDYGPSYATLFERQLQDFMNEQQMTIEDLLAEARSEIDKVQLQGQMTLDFQQSTEDLGNGATKVYLDAGSLKVQGSAVDAGETITFDATLGWNKLCGWVEATVNGELISEDSCVYPDDVSGFDPNMEQFAQEFDRVFIVVNEQNGAYYVSYVETGLAYADMILDSFDAAN